MHVTLVLLREQGRKRPPEEVKADRGVPGYLLLNGGMAQLKGHPTGGSTSHWLFDAVVKRIDDGHILLYGVETVPQKFNDRWKQAWWVRTEGAGKLVR